MLPSEYRTPYEVVTNNDHLAKGVAYYVKEIARQNGLLLGTGERSLLVTSIASVIKLLKNHGYYAYLESSQQLGLTTEANFIFEDRGADKSAIQTRLTLISEDYQDLKFFGQPNR